VDISALFLTSDIISQLFIYVNKFFDFLILTGTIKRSALCFFAVAGIASSDADIRSLTFAVFIILAMMCFTFYSAFCIWHSCYIHKSVFFSRLKAAATGSFCCVRHVAFHLDFVKAASFIYIVMAGCYGTI